MMLTCGHVPPAATPAECICLPPRAVAALLLAAASLAVALQDLDYTNNTGITGVIPPEMGLLEPLRLSRLAGTSMSCSGIVKPYTVTTNYSCSDPKRCTTPQLFGGNDTTVRRCSDDQLLPCFLMFSEYAIPREDASNMRCKYIVRKRPDQALADCEGAADGYQLGDQAPNLPDIVREGSEQQWVVDPAYFQYRACTCLQVRRQMHAQRVCAAHAVRPAAYWSCMHGARLACTQASLPCTSLHCALCCAVLLSAPPGLR